jgi:hypothetical protein
MLLKWTIMAGHRALMSAIGTFLPSDDVRYSVAIGDEADLQLALVNRRE